MMNKGCKGCEVRHEGCHSECQAYAEYLAEMKKAKEYNASFGIIYPSDFGSMRRRGGKLKNARSIDT